MLAKLRELEQTLEGELLLDQTTKLLYSTDASVYKEMPLGVAFPKNDSDVQKIVRFAFENGQAIIPRTAGTSLAGQVVGKGLVVDTSRYMTEILEVNKEEKWVRVQPGVIRDTLNHHLKSHGLFFGPETSTSNRCMIGGMVGNNSCGSHSIIYGTTRDHLLEVKGFLSDGTPIEFKAESKAEFDANCNEEGLKGDIYKQARELLGNSEIRNEIKREFPKPEINRRNTGYAVDVLMDSEVFSESEKPFNFSKLIAGSEGTLAFLTEIKLNLFDTPPPVSGVVVVHCKTLEESFEANLVALKHKPGAVELIDQIILDCTKENIEHSKNREYVQGDPGSLLVVEFARETKEEIEQIAQNLISDLKTAGYGYHYPLLFGADVKKVWALRKAGLGLLANIPGDAKAVACIEDTAVHVEDLPAYMSEFKKITDKYEKECVYYAHIGDGEIHLRPVLDLKVDSDRELFFKITDEVASLVKKYNGSMSGEHGDGRVRGPFVKKMIGNRNYEVLKKLKAGWDRKNILNPGKIVSTPEMNEFLRYEKNQTTPDIPTRLTFNESDGILRMAEKCNGSGDCRKTPVSGGTMCPSYMATRDEKDTTRARANILREFLTTSLKKNRFDHPEIKEILDLCLSCKGCKSECPSNVDMAKLKSEFQYQYGKEHGFSKRAKSIAKVAGINKKYSSVPWMYNFGARFPLSAPLVKGVMGVAQKRKLPTLYKTTLFKWARKNASLLKPENPKKTVFVFADEVINYTDVEIGIKGLKLLAGLGYEVEVLPIHDSGRPAYSKGYLDHLEKVAQQNIAEVDGKVGQNSPLIGFEPSGILMFRDEYLDILDGGQLEKAKSIAPHTYYFEEFLATELEAGNLDSAAFGNEQKSIKIHGHCHQKAISTVETTKSVLTLPENYEAEIIPSGCCGMSGSFGYEKEHYEVSMKIGELVLFPAIRNKAKDQIIAAPGTSCRHQIMDGTGEKALHPIEILYDALVNKI